MLLLRFGDDLRTPIAPQFGVERGRCRTLRSKFNDEIRQDLSFDGRSGLIADVILPQFDSPFGDSSGEICLPEKSLQWVFGYDHYCEGLEVVGELPRGADERQGELFKLQIPGLGVQQGFACVIDRPLLAVVLFDEYRAHCMVRDRQVQEQCLSKSRG